MLDGGRGSRGTLRWIAGECSIFRKAIDAVDRQAGRQECAGSSKKRLGPSIRNRKHDGVSEGRDRSLYGRCALLFSEDGDGFKAEVHSQAL